MITPENWLAITCAIPGYAVSSFAETWLSLRREALSRYVPDSRDAATTAKRPQAPEVVPSPSSSQTVHGSVPCLPSFAARVG